MATEFKVLQNIQPSDSQSVSLIPVKAKIEHERNFISSTFAEREKLGNDLFGTNTEDSKLNFRPVINIENSIATGSNTWASDAVSLIPWKLTNTYSGRIIEFYEDVVVLECLINKEREEYEEVEFKKSLFVNYVVEVGQTFLLKYYERPNESKMEIHEDIKSTLAEDFPNKDFKNLFKNSKLFNK